MDIVERVKHLCRRERLFSSEGSAVVMCSGGQDSLALLHLLASGGLRDAGPAGVVALHVNHHLRGPESDADQRLVEVFCGSFGVPLRVEHRPIEKSSGNVQETARLARTAAGLAFAAEAAAPALVVGHTLDDQAETLLYRASRYGGLRSLRAMRPREGPWVRPFLIVRRSETETYCRERGLAFAVDRGNLYPGYARTGIRARLLPLLEELLPGAAEALARTAEVSSEALAIVDDAVTRAKNDVQAGGVLSARRLRALPPPLRRAVLHRLLEDGVGMGVPRLLVLDVEALLSAPGSGRLDVGAGLMIVKEYDDVVFSGESFAAIRTAQLATGALPIAAGVPESVPAGASARGAVAVPDAASAVTDAASVPVATAVLPVPGFAMFLDLRVRAELVPGFAAHDPRAEAYLDADRIGSMLTVRGVCRGDRMRPLGTKGSRLLQDILVDRGVPAGRRSRVPVVHSGNTVVWLGGVAVSESSRITSGTRRYARLSIEGAAESDGQVGSSAGEQTHEGLDL